MPRSIDLMADLGEGFGRYALGDDDALLEVVTSANVACGFHAGDPRVMDRTVAACVTSRVGIGAHPSFPDLVGFGRRTMVLTADEVYTDTLYQIGALHAFAQSHGSQVRHVTPHGRLGNLVVTDRNYAVAVAQAVTRFDPSLIIVTQEGELAAAGREAGVDVAIMGLADRAYNEDGTLVARSLPNAVITDPLEVADRVVRMVTEGVVRSVSGVDISVRCDTVLLHGDTAGALELARTVRERLISAGVDIRALRGEAAPGEAARDE